MFEQLKHQVSAEDFKKEIYDGRSKVEKAKEKNGQVAKKIIGKFAAQFAPLGIICIKKEAGSDINYNHEKNDLYREHWPDINDDDEMGYSYSLNGTAWLDFGPEIISKIDEAAKQLIAK